MRSHHPFAPQEPLDHVQHCLRLLQLREVPGASKSHRPPSGDSCASTPRRLRASSKHILIRRNDLDRMDLSHAHRRVAERFLLLYQSAFDLIQVLAAVHGTDEGSRSFGHDGFNQPFR